MKNLNGLNVYHNSFDEKYRSPFGAVCEDSSIVIRVFVEALDSNNIDEVSLRLWNENKGESFVRMFKSSEDSRVYQAVINSGSKGLLWYYFSIEYKSVVYFYSRNDNRVSGEGILDYIPMHSYQITVYGESFEVPKWYREGVMYQIFPDRFYKSENYKNPDSNNVKYKNVHVNWNDKPSLNNDPITGKLANDDYFGGNLSGIIERLDYLHKLGVTIIYLNPIFEASSNHRYNTADYNKIDPMLGNVEIFHELCDKAEEMGISIILDGVFSHTGSDSIYFNKDGNYNSLGAYQSQKSPYYTWYRFNEYPDDYDCWWGVKTLPNVNELDDSYLDFMLEGEFSVVKNWLRIGARGWRLDVADELPNEFIKKLRFASKRAKVDSVIIGEVWEDASNKFSYDQYQEYLLGDELDSVINYPFRNLVLNFLMGKIDADSLYNGSMSLCENYPAHVFYSTMNILGTHDVTRLFTMFNKNIGLQKLAVAIQMTCPGVPCIYYGDETSMEGEIDPLNRDTFPWADMNYEMIDYYKNLIDLRSQIPALGKGKYIPQYFSKNIFAYIRVITDNEDVFGDYEKNSFALVVINRSNEMVSNLNIDLSGYQPENLKAYSASDIESEFTYNKNDYSLNVSINPMCVIILSDENN